MLDIEHISQEEITSLQEEKFQQVIPHLFETPFYQEKFQKLGIKQKDIQSLKDLPSLPITIKKELRDTTIFDRTPYTLKELEFLFSSSGTSGPPTNYFWTKIDSLVLQEASKRALKRLNVLEDDVALISAPMGLQIMWYCMMEQYKSVNAGVVALGTASASKIIKTLIDFSVSILTSLPTLATELYEHMILKDQQSIIQKLKLRQFHFGGDYLTESRRARIEKAWNVDCYNLFGMSEIFGPFAGECKEKNGMHFLSDYIYLEVLDPVTKQPVGPGQIGVAVYTTLWSKGSPLFRYWSDDYIIKEDSVCKCKRTSSRIFYIGRPENMVLINGRRIFASQIEEIILKFSVGNEFKLIIKQDGEITVLIEEFPGYRAPIDEIHGMVSDYCKTHVKIQLVRPGFFPREIPKPVRIEVQK